jgi:hypothetical protein
LQRASFSLNEIAKCTDLTQQQKSERAGRLIKSNPNVGRLLVKLKNEKSLSAGGGSFGGASGGGGNYDVAASAVLPSSPDFHSGTVG